MKSSSFRRIFGLILGWFKKHCSQKQNRTKPDYMTKSQGQTEMATSNRALRFIYEIRV